MSSPELQPDQTPRSHWARKINAPSPIDPHDHLRERILEEDRKKRQILLFISCSVIASIVLLIIFLSFRMNLLQDSTLVNNIDLLSNKEEIDFYNKMEFYQWLDLAIAEKPPQKN